MKWNDSNNLDNSKKLEEFRKFKKFGAMRKH